MEREYHNSLKSKLTKQLVLIVSISAFIIYGIIVYVCVWNATER